jgi:hypothetical protein
VLLEINASGVCCCKHSHINPHKCSSRPTKEKIMEGAHLLCGEDYFVTDPTTPQISSNIERGALNAKRSAHTRGVENDLSDAN